MLGKTRRTELDKVMTAAVVVEAAAVMVTQADHAFGVLRQAGDALEKASSSLNDFAVNAGGTAGLVLLGVAGLLALVRGGMSLVLSQQSTETLAAEELVSDLPADVMSKKIEKMRGASDARGKILSTAETKGEAVAMGIAYAWDSLAIATLAGKAAVFSAASLATGGLLAGGIALQLGMSYVKVKAEESAHKKTKRTKYHGKRQALITRMDAWFAVVSAPPGRELTPEESQFNDLRKALKGDLAPELSSEDRLIATHAAYQKVKRDYMKPSAAPLGDEAKAKAEAEADKIFSKWNLFKVSAYHGANGIGYGMLLAFGVFFALGALSNPISGGVILGAGLVVGLYKAVQAYRGYKAQKSEYARLHQKVAGKEAELTSLSVPIVRSHPPEVTGVKKVDTVVSGVVAASSGLFLFRNISNPVLSALRAVPSGVAGALTSALGGLATCLAYFFCYSAVNTIKERQAALRAENDTLGLQVLAARKMSFATPFRDAESGARSVSQASSATVGRTPSPPDARDFSPPRLVGIAGSPSPV